MSDRRRNSGENDDEKRQLIISVICYVVMAVSGAGLIGSVIAYSLTKYDVLFIPIALCAVVCLISFTYARLRSR